MHLYRAYGLRLASELELPELLPDAGAEGAPDAIIRRGRVNLPPGAARVRGCFHLEAGAAFFYWDRAGTFEVRAGREIIVEEAPGVEVAAVRFCLLGWPLTALLHQLNWLVLHGSAVDVCGQAVAFLGTKGQGKSTMAATLYGRGHALLTDDAVVVEEPGGANRVRPGFPQFKLMGEAAEKALGDEAESLPLLFSEHVKRARRVEAGFARESSPLRRIYLLRVGDEIEAEPVPPGAALMHLVANSYVVQFGQGLLKGEESARHFRQCAALLQNVPVFVLRRPDSLDRLPDVARFIEQELTNGS